MVKSLFFRLVPAFLTVLFLGLSCSTTRVLESGQYRLAANKVNVKGDDRFNAKEIESYIKQKPNSYIIFGWNPFLILYNWSCKDADKAVNKLIRKLGTSPVVYQPSQVESSIENIKRHLEYMGYYGSEVTSDVQVKGKKVDVTYSVTLGKRFRIGEMAYSLPEGEFNEDFLSDTSDISIKSGDFLSEDA